MLGRLRRELQRHHGGLPAPLPRSASDGAARVCRMVFDELCVLANGDMVCSCGDPAGLRVYGNVHRDRIDDVYNGRRYREIRRWQLASQPDSWCPVIGTACGGRVSRATAHDTERRRVVRTLQLEPVSACNLRCPSCPATKIGERDQDYAPDRLGVLPLEVMVDVLDQLPDLEKLLFYNFGEPFLHPQAIPFLRQVRERRPDLVIHTSTNGLALDQAKIDALVHERLVDRIVVSIDGAFPESYATYRRGGRLDRALAALAGLASAERLARNGVPRHQLPEVHWQYILFEWNDSDPELTRAHQLAASIGVPLRFVVTHTAGASRRFLPGSVELAQLLGSTDDTSALTCDLRVQLHDSGAKAAARFAASVSGPQRPLTASPDGGRLLVPVEVANLGSEPWDGRPLRLGVARIDGDAELPGTPLSVLPAPGATTTILLDLRIPPGDSSLRLLVDVVEDGVCWFSDRGATALGIEIRRQPPIDTIPWEELIDLAYRTITGEPADDDAIRYWGEALASRLAFEGLVAALDAGGGEDLGPRDAHRLDRTGDLRVELARRGPLTIRR